MYGGLGMKEMKNVWENWVFLEHNTMTIDCLPMTTDVGLVDQLVLINQGKGCDFRIDNGVIRFRDKVYVPDVPELKNSIFEEGRKSGMSIHPGATKMYQDLNKMFWWPEMKKEVTKFVYAYLTCHKSKI